MIELLTVMAVIGVLTAIGLPALNGFKKAAAVNDGVQGLVSVLRQAQAQAVANQGGSLAAHSVQFAPPSGYSLVSGTTTTTYTLATGITFPALPHPTISFDHLTGAPTAAVADITFVGTTKKILVNPSGVVSSQ